MQIEMTKDIAVKVLETVDAGLVSGLGSPKPGQMCVEAAVCYAMGLPHGDNPSCVSRALRALKIRLNDANWSTNAARAKGMRRLAVAQLGSAGVLDDREFARRVGEVAIRLSVPLALRAAASIQKDTHHKAAMLDAADLCEREPTRENVLTAQKAATAATAAAATAATAAAAAAAATADATVRWAAAATVRWAADAARWAADAARWAADAAARDKALGDFAEAVVQVLIEMKAPGCEWLALTETPVKRVRKSRAKTGAK